VVRLAGTGGPRMGGTKSAWLFGLQKPARARLAEDLRSPGTSRLRHDSGVDSRGPATRRRRPRIHPAESRSPPRASTQSRHAHIEAGHLRAKGARKTYAVAAVPLMDRGGRRNAGPSPAAPAGEHGRHPRLEDAARALRMEGVGPAGARWILWVMQTARQRDGASKVKAPLPNGKTSWLGPTEQDPRTNPKPPTRSPAGPTRVARMEWRPRSAAPRGRPMSAEAIFSGPRTSPRANSRAGAVLGRGDAAALGWPSGGRRMRRQRGLRLHGETCSSATARGCRERRRENPELGDHHGGWPGARGHSPGRAALGVRPGRPRQGPRDVCEPKKAPSRGPAMRWTGGAGRADTRIVRRGFF